MHRNIFGGRKRRDSAGKVDVHNLFRDGGGLQDGVPRSSDKLCKNIKLDCSPEAIENYYNVLLEKCEATWSHVDVYKEFKPRVVTDVDGWLEANYPNEVIGGLLVRPDGVSLWALLEQASNVQEVDEMLKGLRGRLAQFVRVDKMFLDKKSSSYFTKLVGSQDSSDETVYRLFAQGLADDIAVYPHELDSKDVLTLQQRLINAYLKDKDKEVAAYLILLSTLDDKLLGYAKQIADKPEISGSMQSPEIANLFSEVEYSRYLVRYTTTQIINSLLLKKEDEDSALGDLDPHENEDIQDLKLHIGDAVELISDLPTSNSPDVSSPKKTKKKNKGSKKKNKEAEDGGDGDTPREIRLKQLKSMPKKDKSKYELRITHLRDEIADNVLVFNTIENLIKTHPSVLKNNPKKMEHVVGVLEAFGYNVSDTVRGEARGNNDDVLISDLEDHSVDSGSGGGESPATAKPDEDDNSSTSPDFSTWQIPEEVQAVLDRSDLRKRSGSRTVAAVGTLIFAASGLAVNGVDSAKAQESPPTVDVVSSSYSTTQVNSPTEEGVEKPDRASRSNNGNSNGTTDKPVDSSLSFEGANGGDDNLSSENSSGSQNDGEGVNRGATSDPEQATERSEVTKPEDGGALGQAQPSDSEASSSEESSNPGATATAPPPIVTESDPIEALPGTSKDKPDSGETDSDTRTNPSDEGADSKEDSDTSTNTTPSPGVTAAPEPVESIDTNQPQDNNAPVAVEASPPIKSPPSSSQPPTVTTRTVRAPKGPDGKTESVKIVAVDLKTSIDEVPELDIETSRLLVVDDLSEVMNSKVKLELQKIVDVIETAAKRKDTLGARPTEQSIIAANIVELEILGKFKELHEKGEVSARALRSAAVAIAAIRLNISIEILNEELEKQGLAKTYDLNSLELPENTKEEAVELAMVQALANTAFRTGEIDLGVVRAALGQLVSNQIIDIPQADSADAPAAQGEALGEVVKKIPKKKLAKEAIRQAIEEESNGAQWKELGVTTKQGLANLRQILLILANADVSPKVMAGMLGNGIHEGGPENPLRMQNSATYVTKDQLMNANFGGAGLGLFQYDGSRRVDFLNKVKNTDERLYNLIIKYSTGSNRGTDSGMSADENERVIEAYMKFVLNEIKNKRYGNSGKGYDPSKNEIEIYEGLDSVHEVTMAFLDNFERAGIPHTSERIEAASVFKELIVKPYQKSFKDNREDVRESKKATLEFNDSVGNPNELQRKGLLMSAARVTSKFGEARTIMGVYQPGHSGEDRAKSPGETFPLKAMIGGEVYAVVPDNGPNSWGNMAVVYHGEQRYTNASGKEVVKPIYTIYPHMAGLPKVKKGDKVKRGQTLGPAGDTGFSAGIHQHAGLFSKGGLAKDGMSFTDDTVWLDPGVFEKKGANAGKNKESKHGGGGAIKGEQNSEVFAEGRLQRDSKLVGRAALTKWGEIKTIGGYRANGGGYSDHPDGRAVDIMLPGGNGLDNPKLKKLGDEMARFFKRNARAYGIEYIIWYQEIWSVARADEGWRKMENRGGITVNHYDHLHITTHGNQAKL